MGSADALEFVAVVGTLAAAGLRLAMLGGCVVALASAQRLTLARAWAALLLPLGVGLLLGLVGFAVLWPWLRG